MNKQQLHFLFHLSFQFSKTTQLTFRWRVYFTPVVDLSHHPIPHLHPDNFPSPLNEQTAIPIPVPSARVFYTPNQTHPPHSLASYIRPTLHGSPNPQPIPYQKQQTLHRRQIHPSNPPRQNNQTNPRLSISTNSMHIMSTPQPLFPTHFPFYQQCNNCIILFPYPIISFYFSQNQIFVGIIAFFNTFLQLV